MNKINERDHRTIHSPGKKKKKIHSNLTQFRKCFIVYHQVHLHRN
jgi:hypothetical protein